MSLDSLFGIDKSEPTQPPDRDSAQVKEAARRERRRRAAATGRQSTILTVGDDEGGTALISRKSALGQ